MQGRGDVSALITSANWEICEGAATLTALTAAYLLAVYRLS